MEILYLLIPISVLLVFIIAAAFWWSLRSGQYDDLEGPGYRVGPLHPLHDCIAQVDRVRASLFPGQEAVETHHIAYFDPVNPQRLRQVGDGFLRQVP